MFDFEKNIYLSKKLIENEEISIKAKCLFAYMDNVSAKTGNRTILLYQKELMEILKIKSKNTLKKILAELIVNEYIKVQGNKYTILKSYVCEGV